MLAVFLDLRRAFNELWKEDLARRMMLMGVSSEIVELVRNYLGDGSFRIMLEGGRSSLRKIESGVPRVSLLGPKLFLVFMSDLPKTVGVKMAVCADDIVVYSTCRSSWQERSIGLT